MARATPAGPGTQDVLLATTRSLVAERGYEGATLTRICERSATQRSSIYWRFKNKDELIRAAVADPFLTLVSASRLGPVATPDVWPSMLAASLQRSVIAAMSSQDTVKAGLLLKLQRRDPLSLGSQAIQLGVAREVAALDAWIAAAVDVTGAAVDAAELGWTVSVLREGLLLGVAFGQSYVTPALSELTAAMIDGILAGVAAETHTSTI
ncbi:MAG: helix-turn-helix domain containing protein [Arthrobacter sp.]|nr:helix-turn-helix domain containing protein [Arthrobacter sp.]